MKVTINQLLGSEMTLGNAQNRGNIPTNHAISRNLSRVKRALEPFRQAQKEEPMCWHFWEQLHPQKPETKGNNKKDETKKPTKSQRKDGLVAVQEYLQLDVEFEPYKLQLSRCSDELRQLSKSREFLSEEDLQITNENFTIVLRDLEILTDEV